MIKYFHISHVQFYCVFLFIYFKFNMLLTCYLIDFQNLCMIILCYDFFFLWYSDIFEIVRLEFNFLKAIYVHDYIISYAFVSCKLFKYFNFIYKFYSIIWRFTYVLHYLVQCLDIFNIVYLEFHLFIAIQVDVFISFLEVEFLFVFM